ncbi:DUF5050 domain-containing protein [Butyrivibrio sp. MB2005]|uniref:DUF5050 domain-containing protein n=1 Tax=Butyrivibrio sp. MB2005 TaxID=1280678 RepID=UPI00047A555C|nr:DUF5050 domain-containing protein [Butyrivibrio sp. MB2005]
MESKKGIIIFSLIVIVLSLVTVAYMLSKRVPMNDEYTVGNTPGNLYNNGIFLELDGTVYFSNPLEYDCLYSMTPDETNLKQLTVMKVDHILGAGKFLYFNLDPSKTSLNNDLTGLGKVSTFYGLYRCEKDGENQKLLDRQKIGSMQLVGSNIYYTVLGTDKGLHRIRIDGKDDALVTSEMLDPSCALDGKIYYTGVDLDHNIHVMDTLSDESTSTAVVGNIWQPIIQGGYMYYIDAAHHYRLARMNLQTNEIEVLTESRLDFYNMNENNIFYATSESGNQTLRVINLDGSNNRVIAEGVYHSLSLTSKYLYFKPFGVDNVIYHVPIDGSAPVSTFLTY